MTFDDDMVWFELQGCTRRYTCRELNISWPPPRRMTYQGTRTERVRMTTMTDEQRARMTNTNRIATYQPKARMK